MLVELEISPMYIIQKLMENHSNEYLFETIARLSGHISPEEFSKKVSKLLEEGIE